VNSVEIVRGVSGIFRAGEVVLALGDKESGLSALLDIISGQFKDVYGETSEMAGKLHINNYQPHAQFLKTLVGHVHTGGMFFGKLTAKETLHYYASLKMSRNAPKKEKSETADNLLREFGFSDKLYIPACDLSAEFKLRLNIAVQMLNNPFIVIVDDQLRGLDFTATKDILELLKKISQQGRIVICSAEYAQHWMLSAVDGVLLLAQGGIVFFGRCSRLLRHFKKIGFVAPPAADAVLHILGLLRTDTHSSATEVESKNRIRAILEKWNTAESFEEVMEVQKMQFPKIQMVTDLFQYEKFLLLLKRMIKERLRYPHLIILSVLMPLLYSALISMVFSETLTSDLAGIQSRLGLIFATNLYLVFGFFHGLLVFPKANEMFIREYKDKSCTPSGFYLSYLASNFVIEFITAVAISLLVLFANHMNASAEIFFSFVFFLILLLSSGHAFAVLLISILPSALDVAVSVFSVGVTIILVASAVLSTGVFVVLDYFRYTSLFTHFSFVTAIYEFKGLNFACSGTPLFITHDCPVTGQMVLEALLLDKRGHEGLFIGLAVVCTLAYQIIAFVCFSKVQKALIKR
jgi:ABC-type multidrug transport system ATPase subunit